MPSLKGQFLVAKPSLTDPNFARAVVLILRHDAGGAVGVVVNRPLEVTVRQACEQVLGIEQCEADGVLFHGGPCEAVLMAIYADAGSVAIEDDGTDEPSVGVVLPGIAFSTDKVTLERLLGDPPAAAKFVVGYAGWGEGQLEGEMASGSWLTIPATADRVFGVFAPADALWTRLVTEANLGKYIDPKRIPPDASVN